MAVATFDTLKFANALKAAGVPDKQAEAHAVAFAEVVQVNFKDLATKEDLARVSADLRAEIDRVAKAAKADLESTAKDLRREIADAKSELLRAVEDARQDTKLRIDTFQAKHTGDIALLRWMLALAITLMGGIAIRLFFFKP